MDEKTVAREWDENAPQWIAEIRRGDDVLREALNNPAFFRLLPDVRDLKIIDLGCGEGHNTRLIARMGGRMTGVDISPKMIEAATAAEVAEPLGIRYEVCSFTSLTAFRDECFDMVVSQMAFMGSPHFARAAREAYRVLRTGGRLFFSVLHPCFWTRGSRWMFDPNGRDQGLLVTDYWLAKPYLEVDKFRFSSEGGANRPYCVPRFPLRMETYVNGLCRAGFRITRLIEPRPSKKAVHQHPELLGPVYRHVPISILFAAVKR